MSNPLAEGDKVRVKDREQTAADIKSQLFYDHYRNLVGTVAKIYADGTASINVDQAALPKEISQRHDQTASGIRQKWLDGLSEEARNKLSAADKSFALRYTIIVSLSDLEPYSGDTPTPRKTLAELEAEEAKHLEQVRKQKEG
jgi:hypothetical protein